MMNRPTDKEEGNHDNHNLETGGSLRAPELCPVQPLEIQRGHSEVTATHTYTHTHTDRWIEEAVREGWK